MAGYSKMDIMSMSEDDIRRALKEEGVDLPDYTVYFMVEELKRREQFEEAVKAAESEEDAEDIEDEEDAEEELEEEPEEETEEPEKTEEELEAEAKKKRAEEDRQLVADYKKSRKQTLILALVCAGIAAVAATGFIIYLYASGTLQ